MSKSPLAIARDKWIETDEFKRISQGSTQGQYLLNRLELAFIAGWNARESKLFVDNAVIKTLTKTIHLDIQSLYETLDWMLKDMKCKFRWEKNIPEELEDCQVDFSPELTKAIELHRQLKSFLEG